MNCNNTIYSHHIIVRFCMLMITLLLGYRAGDAHSAGTEYRYPVYNITISQQFLESMNHDPSSSVYYPAELTWQGTVIPVEVRYRGSTSIHYSKKSWKLEFKDEHNIFGVEEINLNAEYIDRSFLRNYLANSLFSYLYPMAPECRYAHLVVNDEHMGLFLQVEQIDKLFLKRNGRNKGVMYKAINHGANMSPLAHDAYYPLVWEPKGDQSNDFSELKSVLMRMKYWTPEDFEQRIGDVINVSDFLMYYAILFSISSNDNYMKNCYFYTNPVSGKHELIPWDNDATFGIDWKGDYLTGNESFINGSYLDYQVAFRRLMQYDQWRELFWSHVHTVVTSGFDYLDATIDNVYEDLGHDVALDKKKPGADGDFEDAVAQLRTFLHNRRTTLEHATGFDTGILSEYHIQPIDEENGETVAVSVRSSVERPIECLYVTDLDPDVWGDTYSVSRLTLYDDGLHHDMAAGDLIYGNTLTFGLDDSDLVPVSFFTGGKYYPENGFLYLNYYRTHSLMINRTNDTISALNDVTLGTVYQSGGHRFVELINQTGTAIDVSYCYLQCGEYYNRTLLPEGSVIQRDGRLIVTTDSLYASILFPDEPICINECNMFNDGDRIALLAPDFTAIDIIDEVPLTPLGERTPGIVINEINYNSSDDFDPGDWVELYNTENSAIDVGDWIFSDADDDHEYAIPPGSIIEAHGYLVITQNENLFETLFPGVNHVGDTGFGFSGSGELLRLYNDLHVLVDSLTYDDRFPWPDLADGEGRTLALTNPGLDNAIAGNWTASSGHGTPGKRNDVFVARVPDGLSVSRNYPNPFAGITAIDYSLSVEKRVAIQILNASGQIVYTILDATISPGDHTIMIDASAFPCGLYFYRFRTDTSEQYGKMMVIR